MSAKVLAAAEPLSDGERWRAMQDLGRRAQTNDRAKAELAELAAAAGFYPRRLAVMAGSASRLG
jgi:hypothetical protein